MRHVIVLHEGIREFDHRLPYYESILTDVYGQVKNLEDFTPGVLMSDVDFSEQRSRAEWMFDGARTATEEHRALQQIAAWCILQIAQDRMEADSRR